MIDEKIQKICKAIQEIYTENPQLFSNTKKNDDWYGRRKYFLDQNEILLNLLVQKLNDKTLSENEFFWMQKLFLMYPDSPPKKLLSLSWDKVKLILSLCEQEKRKFYTDVCYYLELDDTTLKKYILNDLYEKVIFLIQEIQDYNIVNEDSFLIKVIDIYDMVYEV